MKTLPPLILSETHWLAIEAEIALIFKKIIYLPMKAALAAYPLEIKNNYNVLADALANNRIFYEQGVFSGQFTAQISKELTKLGATFNSRSKTFHILPSNLPSNISVAAAQAELQMKQVKQVIVTSLDKSLVLLQDGLPENDLQTLYEKSITSMNEQLETAVARVGIPAKLTAATKQIIAQEWTNNLKLYIKGWAQNNIVSLREQITSNSLSGRRAENLINLIQSNYSVSKTKARFLARQETSLLMSKMRETRYKDAGITKYKWSTSHDERVRPMHKKLNGRIISWSDPPITDEKGNRNHAGEDFGCRCIAIPVIELK